MSIAEIRREYTAAGLRRDALHLDPIAQFRKWFDEATGKRSGGRLRKLCVRACKSLVQVAGSEPMDVNAMTLATADGEGRPSARIVLLKGLDDRGFIFFTNYDSRKGRELERNPHAALVFYWANLERQVCAAGKVARVAPDESNAYFNSRPRGSRLAAWVSSQSRVVPDRAAMEAKWNLVDAEYPNREIPRPNYWGGYVLQPTRIEFWQGRPNRLHDRFQYTRLEDNTWKIERLAP